MLPELNLLSPVHGNVSEDLSTPTNRKCPKPLRIKSNINLHWKFCWWFRSNNYCSEIFWSWVSQSLFWISSLVRDRYPIFQTLTDHLTNTVFGHFWRTFSLFCLVSCYCWHWLMDLTIFQLLNEVESDVSVRGKFKIQSFQCDGWTEV